MLHKSIFVSPIDDSALIIKSSGRVYIRPGRLPGYDVKMGTKKQHGHLLRHMALSIFITLTQADTNAAEQIRVVHFLCNFTSSTLGYTRIQPAFYLAYETIQTRIENGVYQNFTLDVTSSLHGCSYSALGTGVDLYTAQPYHAIFGPPVSGPTIGKIWFLQLHGVSEGPVNRSK